MKAEKLTTSFSANAKLAGLMGWPVHHSWSPKMHNFWLQQLGLDGVYIPIPVLPDHLPQAIKAIAAMGMAGVNITAPHKLAALKLLDDIEPEAEKIGAVNTILVRDNGRLFGRNSDAPGFVGALILAFPHFVPQQKAITIIGAGGAARAIISGLQMAGAENICLVNRDMNRAEAVAQGFSAVRRILPFAEINKALPMCDLLINATSLGMQGQAPLHLPLEALPASAIVADIVYQPRLTPLLQSAQQRGLPILDGLGMLIEQGRLAFAGFFNATPPASDITRQFLLEA